MPRRSRRPFRNRLCGIYLIQHSVTGRAYVGQSVDILRRWADHAGGKSSELNEAIRSEPTLFHFSVLELCSKELLGVRERHWILMYSTNTYNKKHVRPK